MLDDARVDLGASVQVRPGQTLRLGPTTSGARCYLCVQGGVSVKPFLGSASTHLLSGMGGFEGRHAQRRRAAHRARMQAFPRQKIAAKASEQLCEREVLRVTSGPQADWFSDPSLHEFYAGSYRVGEQSNRMGLRLEGAAILRRGRAR